MHEESKRKEKGTQSGEAMLVVAQNKGGSHLDQGCVMCACGKLSHIVQYCFDNKKEKESANNASNKGTEEKHTFAINNGDAIAMAK